MHYSTVGPYEVVFSHIDPDTGEQQHLAITQMLAWIKGTRLGWQVTPVEAAAAEMVAECRGIERHRLLPLLKADPYMYDPVVYITLPDATHLLVDGSHRYVAAHAQGAHRLRAYILTWEEAQPFIITGLPVMPPEKVIGGYSGL